MTEIILTGYSKREFKKKKGFAGRCYICKRKHNDKGVYILSGQKGKYELELYFRWLEIIKGPESGLVKQNTKFRFYICRECMILMEAMQDKFSFSRLFSEKKIEQSK